MIDLARQALELVVCDSDARAAFVAAYTGDGDAVAALRESVEPDAAAAEARDAELARLRRLAFGRTETHEDETVAAHARRDLEEIAAGERARRQALDRAVAAVLEGRAHPPVDDEPETAARPDDGGGDDGDDDDDDDPAAAAGDESARRRHPWILPAAVGVAVGAVLAASAGVLIRPGGDTDDEPTPGVTSPGGLTYFLGDPPESTAVPGDLAAAERWFEPEQSDDDLVGVGELRPEFDRASVRLVHSSSLARVWVAKKVDGALCLETTETETQITIGTCATTGDFAVRGLSLSSDVLTASWNGSQVRVVVTRR